MTVRRASSAGAGRRATSSSALPVAGAAVLVDPRQVARVRKKQASTSTFVVLAEMFRALGDSTRLQIVSALAHGELCVSDLSNLVAVSDSVVSHSLRALRQLRVVQVQRTGKIAFYSLDTSLAATLVVDALRRAKRRRLRSGAT